MDRINECNTLISWKFWSHWAKRHSNMMKSNIDCPLKKAWPPQFAQPFLNSPCSGWGKAIQSPPFGCPLSGRMGTVTMPAPTGVSNLRVTRHVFAGLGAGDPDKTAWEDGILSCCLSKWRGTGVFYDVSTQRTQSPRPWVVHRFASLHVWKMLSWLSFCGTAPAVSYRGVPYNMVADSKDKTYELT